MSMFISVCGQSSAPGSIAFPWIHLSFSVGICSLNVSHRKATFFSSKCVSKTACNEMMRGAYKCIPHKLHSHPCYQNPQQTENLSCKNHWSLDQSHLKKKLHPNLIPITSTSPIGSNAPTSFGELLFFARPRYSSGPLRYVVPKHRCDVVEC